MTFGSCFTGCGGIDLGLQQSGLHCRWQIEIDPKALAVLFKHWPEIPKYADIRGIDTNELEPVDVLAGSLPCQPFSSASAGKCSGTSDDRWLWAEMLRIGEVLKPTWFVSENVALFDGLGLEQMVSDLEALGYEVAPPLEIPACAIGQDHRRSRYWILGYSDSYRKSRLSIDAEMAMLPQRGRYAGRVGAPNVIPGRMDRLRMIGNAADPQIVQKIGMIIAESAP